MISEFVKQSKKAAKNLKARPGRLVVVEYDKKERQNFIFDKWNQILVPTSRILIS